MLEGERLLLRPTRREDIPRQHEFGRMSSPTGWTALRRAPPESVEPFYARAWPPLPSRLAGSTSAAAR